MTYAMDATSEIGAEVASRGGTAVIENLIGIIREGARANPRIFTDPAVKHWCARRWRFLFLREAVEDQVALAAATLKNDLRSPRQRIAERFLAEDVAEAWQDEQPDPVEGYIQRTTLLVCPGLLNGMLPAREFRDELPMIAWRYRMRVLRSASHPARGCEANVADIMRALEEGRGSDAEANIIPDEVALTDGPPGDVVVLAYSKGAPDILTALVKRPEITDRVRCIFTIAGAIGGSQVADEVAAKFKATRFERQAANLSFKLKAFAHSAMNNASEARRRVDEFDSVGAVRDLTTSVRQDFLREHCAALDAMNIPMFTLRGVTSLSEVPISQRGGCKLLSTFEPQHDMQVAGSCSKLPIPMATELAVLHGHHWDLAYPAFSQRRWLNNTTHPFPRSAAITAMVQLARELGLAE